MLDDDLRIMLKLAYDDDGKLQKLPGCYGWGGAEHLTRNCDSSCGWIPRDGATAVQGLRLSNLVVVDIDDPKLIGLLPRPVETRIHRTARGAHLLYRGEHARVRYSSWELKHGAKSYVVMPDELSAPFGYSVVSDVEPLSVKSLEFAAVVADLRAGSPERPMTANATKSMLAKAEFKGSYELAIPEGSRDNTLVALAGFYARENPHIEYAEMLDRLADDNMRQCKPPLPDADIARIAGQGMKFAQRDLNDR